jgi:hypothetical protein
LPLIEGQAGEDREMGTFQKSSLFQRAGKTGSIAQKKSIFTFVGAEFHDKMQNGGSCTAVTNDKTE